MSDEAKQPRVPRNTAPKGGSRFPRYDLKTALAWATKAVAKTHSGPVGADIIFASVVTSKGSTAEMKVSALKQFGLLQGTSKAYGATDLARGLSSAPQDEQASYLRQAALTPAVFKSLYDTFHGDRVTIPELKQRAADLQVHPENLSACIDTYTDSLAFAGLVKVNGDSVDHEGKITGSGTEVTATVPSSEEDSEEITTEDNGQQSALASNSGENSQPSPRAVFHVNVNLDASLDTEKLERQLGLLKRFGAI